MIPYRAEVGYVFESRNIAPVLVLDILTLKKKGKVSELRMRNGRPDEKEGRKEGGAGQGRAVTASVRPSQNEHVVDLSLVKAVLVIVYGA